MNLNIPLQAKYFYNVPEIRATEAQLTTAYRSCLIYANRLFEKKKMAFFHGPLGEIDLLNFFTPDGPSTWFRLGLRHQRHTVFPFRN